MSPGLAAENRRKKSSQHAVATHSMLARQDELGN
jgi:hypothetical protein